MSHNYRDMIHKYKDMTESFKNSRMNIQEKDDTPKSRQLHVPPKNQRRSNSSSYDNFLFKLDKLGDTIDTFTTRDFVYYFREMAERNGYKYVVSNIKKDMAIMKRLQENYTAKEICAMIEFLYESEQDYLDKDRLSPNLLVSQWVNTIYADTNLWIDDNYVPKSKQLSKKAQKGEWKDNNNSGTTIGLKL